MFTNPSQSVHDFIIFYYTIFLDKVIHTVLQNLILIKLSGRTHIMNKYFEALTTIFKDWKKAVPVLFFTVIRLIYGWSFFQAGWHKLAWLSDGKINSAGKIKGLVTNIATGTADKPLTHFDPLYINKAFGWVAQNIFLSMPALTDFLVVVLEMAVGILIILGFRVLWGALIAMFFNTQFIAGGSFNNFGYIWTNLAFMKWAKYTEAIGLDGFLRIRKGKELL